jgi:hypothetical protein
LLDISGIPLQDGDWVYAAWTGPDGQIDQPNISGGVTNDDVLLINAVLEYSNFFFTVTTWAPEDGNHPMTGELIYCRMFDGRKEEIGPANFYADSQTYEVTNIFGEEFFCLFPGDPGAGHTNTPVPGGTVVEVVTASGIPSEFALFPNRPNPFNASTEIRYCLPADGAVSLKIFNTLGQEVRSLVEGDQAAGEYHVMWNGRDGCGMELSSGLYFCHLQVEEAFSRTVKMVLLR